MRGIVKKLVDTYLKNGGERTAEAITNYVVQNGYTPTIGEEDYIDKQVCTLIWRFQG